MGLQDRLIEAHLPWRKLMREEAARRQSPAFAKEADKILADHLALVDALHTDMHDIASKRILSEHKKARRSLELFMEKNHEAKRTKLPEFVSVAQAGSVALNELRDGGLGTLDEDVEKLISDIEKENEKLSTVFYDADEVFQHLDEALCDFSRGVNESLLFRVISARAVHFIGKHLFTLLFVLFVCGYLYSKAWTTAASLVVEYVTSNPLISIFAIIGSLVFKEYVLSKYIKRVRVKLETRLLLPVARAIFAVRTRLLLN
jgi:hypothetical protein